MKSFFQRLYKYKQSDLRHQKENFLTEILAYCLENDHVFNDKFLTKIGIESVPTRLKCQTQLNDTDLGIPDVFITVDDDTQIIIECKIGSTQEETQLTRYADMLLKQPSNHKYLIYLTKYYEETQKFPEPIVFKHLRWYEIYYLIGESTNDITKELSNYLISEKMSTKISFNRSELSSLKDFQETFNKMTEFLARLKDTLNKYSTAKVRLPKALDNSSYGIECNLPGGLLWLGFYQYENNDEIMLCISVEANPQNTQHFDNMDHELLLLNWVSYDNEQGTLRTWYNSKALSTFFDNDLFDSNKAHDFIDAELSKIKKWL